VGEVTTHTDGKGKKKIVPWRSGREAWIGNTNNTRHGRCPCEEIRFKVRTCCGERGKSLDG